MHIIKWFKDISSKDTTTCWWKWASLWELMRAWFPFSDGFVLTTQAFWKSQEKREEEVYRAFSQLDTQYVAVRSSASKEDGIEDSFAGQFDTFLFVDKESIIKKIIECHNSLNSNRIEEYCKSKKINKKEIKVAVVVQKMVNSESAGVAFTTHPITNNQDEIVIEWWYGLWEAIVSGKITPDNYIWSKSKQEITQKTINNQVIQIVVNDVTWGDQETAVNKNKQNKQKLSNENIKKLAILSEQIEQYYWKPMDIERALENNKLYILQARPITTIQSFKLEDFHVNNTVFKKNTLVDKISNWEYLRLFSFESFVPLYLSEQFVEAYKSLWGLVLCNKKIRISYMFKIKENETHKKWIMLYSNKKNYEKYKESIYHTNDTIRKNVKQIIKTAHIRQENLEELFKLFLEYEKLYMYTEYFYTDLAYEHITKDNTLKENIQSFEKLKLDWRRFLNELQYLPDCCLFQVIDLIGSVFNISRKDLDYYTKQDLLNLFKWIQVSQEDINKRKDWQILYADKDKISYVYWDISTVLKTKSWNKNNIKWTIANRWIIEWLVRVITIDISKYDQASKFVEEMKEWEILVAETTEPSIIAACNKATGIITNQWWMMSHAAIVSRELNIPCIVWTGDATDLLKTWMKIRLDANLWTITILE